MRTNNPFYKTKKWIRKRENILRRDGYVCRHCKRYGRTTLANTVHHCWVLEEYPELGLIDDNLISLCVRCHNILHNRFTDELTKEGLMWMEKVRRKVEKFISPPNKNKKIEKIKTDEM